MPSQIETMIELLGPQQVIGRAIDLLMSRDHLSRDAAFAQLVQSSADSRQKVRETAAEIITQHTRE